MKPLGAADPTAIASYRLLGVLGSGGMGRVYLAQSPTGRRLAIKVIRADLADNPMFRRRFAHEVAAVRSVSPLFTAPVVDADTDAEAPWLATTFIDGPSLEHFVNEHGPLAPGAVLTLAAGLAEALASMHRAGLVHRDLKPGNVLLDDDGPHIIDFGIAQTPDSTRMTTSLVGTPSYMAPERLRGAEAAPPADIFSLGATLAFAATGRRLADGDGMYEQILQMTSGRFDLSAVPAPVRRLIARCVSRRARERPTATELTRLLSPKPETSTPGTSTPGTSTQGTSTPGVSPPGPGWYRATGSPQTATTEPITIRLPRRRAIAVGGALGAMVVGGGVTALLTALSKAPDASAGTRSAPSPGSVLWQLGSGAVPVLGPSGSWAPTARIAVDTSGWAVTSVAGAVFATGARDGRRWSRTLPGGPFDVRLWGDAVLVNDARRVWLLDGATGAQRSTADPAGDEATVRGTAPDQVPIRQVALLPDRAYLDLSGTVVALDRDLRRLWRVPATPPYPTAAPALAALAAAPTRLLVADRSGSSVRAGLYDAATGHPLWSLPYDLPAMPAPGPPPFPPPGAGPPPSGWPGPPPPGAPPGAPPGPPPGGQDLAWQWSEAKLGNQLVAIRNAQSVQVRRAGDGHLVWQETSPVPVAGIEISGDLLLVAADALTAHRLSTGERAWRKSMPGARLAPEPDGRSTVAAAGGAIAALAATGAVRWHATLPAAAADAVPDRLTVQGRVAYLTLLPRQPRGTPLDVDVLAIRLDGPG